MFRKTQEKPQVLDGFDIFFLVPIVFLGCHISMKEMGLGVGRPIRFLLGGITRRCSFHLNIPKKKGQFGSTVHVSHPWT